MHLRPRFRAALLALIATAILPNFTGCGGGAPTDGTHVDPLAGRDPESQRKAMESAYTQQAKDLKKQQKKGGPTGK